MSDRKIKISKFEATGGKGAPEEKRKAADEIFGKASKCFDTFMFVGFDMEDPDSRVFGTWGKNTQAYFIALLNALLMVSKVVDNTPDEIVEILGVMLEIKDVAEGSEEAKAIADKLATLMGGLREDVLEAANKKENGGKNGNGKEDAGDKES